MSNTDWLDELFDREMSSEEARKRGGMDWDRLADRVAAAARAEVEWFRLPEHRAYVAGCFVGSVVAARQNMTFLPTVVFGVLGGYAAMHAYRACQHLEALANAAGADTTG
jgi:hypothetical protein